MTHLQLNQQTFSNFSMNHIQWLLWSLSLWGMVACDWFSKSEKTDSPLLVSNTLAPPKFDAILQRAKTLTVNGVTWEHYLSISKLFWRGTHNFYVFAHLPKGAPVESRNSMLVGALATLQNSDASSLFFQEIPGTIFELHSVRLGTAFDTQLIFTATVLRKDNIQLVNSYWDVQPKMPSGMQFREVWRVTHVYDLYNTRSYQPPDFHYWDVDDDGLQEIVLTNTWKDKPPLWKYRWAVFHWNPQTRRMEARRGFGLFPFKEQHPEWLALGIVEMQLMHMPETEMAMYFSSAPGCERKLPLQMIAAFEGIVSVPKTVFLDGITARVQLDSQRVSSKNNHNNHTDILRLEFELRNEPVYFDRWRVCRTQLYRVRTSP